MNYEAIYRTAPATPGLLNIYKARGFYHFKVKIVMPPSFKKFEEVEGNRQTDNQILEMCYTKSVKGRIKFFSSNIGYLSFSLE